MPTTITTPDWLEETPDETSYDLTMYDSGGGSIQNVQLSRDEYIDLKEYLSAHRGHCQDAQPKPKTEACDDHAEAPEDDAGKDRRHLIAFVREKLSKTNIDIALMALEAIQRNTGCNTPAENFFRQLVRYLPEGLTPEDVTDCLKEFEENFDSLETDVAYVHRFYPALAAKAADVGKAAR